MRILFGSFMSSIVPLLQNQEAVFCTDCLESKWKNSKNSLIDFYFKRFQSGPIDNEIIEKFHFPQSALQHVFL